MRDALDRSHLRRPAAGALHAHGVRAVMRVERALPPGVPLPPVLDAVLPAGSRRSIAASRAPAEHWQRSPDPRLTPVAPDPPWSKRAPMLAR